MFTIPVSRRILSLCFKVILNCLMYVVTVTLALKRVPGCKPFIVYWDFTSEEFMLKMCTTVSVCVLYRLMEDRVCSLWSFHVRRAVVVVLYTLKEDVDTATVETQKGDEVLTLLNMIEIQHVVFGFRRHRHSRKWKVFVSSTASHLLALSVMLYPFWSSTILNNILQWWEHAELLKLFTYTCKDVTESENRVNFIKTNKT